jgi:HEAT repeat protein
MIKTVAFACSLLLSTSAIARPRLDAVSRRQLLHQALAGPRGVRNRAVQRLYHLQDRQANATLLRLARAAPLSKRLAALWALAIIRPKGAQEVLLFGLKARSWGVRAEAARGLGLLRSRRALRALFKRTRDKQPAVRRAAIMALSRLGRRALPSLFSVAKRNTDDALRAVAAIGLVGGKKATSLLWRLQATRYREELRLLAARQLLKRLDPRGPRALIALLLKGKRVGIRLQAAELLGKDDSSSLGERALRQAMTSRNASVRNAAADALAERKARHSRNPQ